MRLVLACYLLFCLGIVLSADLGHYGPLLALHAAPLGDKAIHVAFAGGLALFTNLALVGVFKRRPLRAALLGSLAVMVLCAAEETTNLLTPYRGFEFADMAANCLGVLLIGLAPPALILTWSRRMMLSDAS
ncbi:MAG: hypothetical protein KDA37_08330 [Planctomycetales bacterium]|nr:hypothetical protein [Planctomycetales bacterium]